MTGATSIVPASGWPDLLADLGRETLMVVGAPGTGKTCLSRYLVSQLDRHFARVALIDGDLGRVSIGVPGCLALALTGPWEAPAAQWFVGGWFAGNSGCNGKGRSAVIGAGRLARRARADGAEAIVLDTPGFDGDPEDVEILADQALAAGVGRVVAIDRTRRGEGSRRTDDALEALLERLGSGRTLHRLSASPMARRPSTEEERERRGRRLRAHFFAAETRRFQLDALLAGEELTERADGNGNGHRNGRRNGNRRAAASAALVGRAVGLLDDSGYCLGLGRLAEAGPEEIAVVTPVRSDRVARLELASFRLGEDGTLL